MTRNNIVRAAGAALLLAAIGAALWITNASAATVIDYRQAFTGAGYSVSTTNAAVAHPTLHTSGQQLTLTKGGQTVALELIVYPSRAALRRDFSAVNGSGPTPLVATKDFDGRVLYWNENVVMALSFAPPNEPGLTRAAADIFLGRRGTGGPAAVTGAAPSTATSLPATGTGSGDTTSGTPGVLHDAAIVAALLGAVVATSGAVGAAKQRA